MTTKIYKSIVLLFTIIHIASADDSLRNDIINVAKINTRNIVYDMDRIDDGFRTYIPYKNSPDDSAYVIKDLYELIPEYETLFLRANPGEFHYEFLTTNKEYIRLIIMNRKKEYELDDFHKDPFNDYPIRDLYKIDEYKIKVPEYLTNEIKKKMLLFKNNKISGEYINELRIKHIYEMMSYTIDENFFYGLDSNIFGFSFNDLLIIKNTPVHQIILLYDSIYKFMTSVNLNNKNEFIEEISNNLK